MPKKVTITQKYGTYKVTPGIWGNVKRDLDLGWAHQRISEHVGIGKTTIAQIKKSRSFEGFVAMNKAITNKRRKKTIEGRQEVHTYIKDDSKHTTIIYSMLFIIILTIVGIFFILSRM